MSKEAPVGKTPHDLVKAEFKRDGLAAVDRVSELFEIVDPEENIGKLKLLTQNKKKIIPVIIGSHQSISDGIGYSEITKQFDGMIFRMPLSDSISGGEQGADLAELFGNAGEGLTQRGIEPVEVRTEGDVLRREMDEKLNLEAMAKLTSLARQGMGLLVWPEGSVEGGRKAKAGAEHDPKLPNPKIVTEGLFQRWIKRGYEPVVLLCAVDGSWRIFDPDEGRIPDEAGLRFLQDGVPEPLAQIYVGEIIRVDEIKNFPNDYSYMNLIGLLLHDSRAAHASGKI